MSKKRLDLLVLLRWPQLSRNQIVSFIMQGKVTVNGKTVTKAGAMVAEDATILCDVTEQKYVCRAGYKLERALQEFDVDVRDKIILDAGLSTGGFTDCLLQNGAKRVYGVDVGYGQVHEKIRGDKRVKILERTNLRYLEDLYEKVDLVTLDLSFISVLKVMPAVVNLMKDNSELIVLIKPQFEAERKDVGRGGIIKDSKVHDRVVKNVKAGIEAFGFTCKGIIDSPIRGSYGNKEFLAYFVRNKPL